MAAQPRGRGRPATAVMYQMCLRNHSAQLGVYTIDGCGEYLPARIDGRPEELLCAACNCHQNFHQRVEVQIPPPPRRRAPRARRGGANIVAAGVPQPPAEVNEPPLSPSAVSDSCSQS